MELSISDILKDLGHESGTEKVAAMEPVMETEKTANEPQDAEKIALYLEALAKPDSVIDELAKLAVLQDWVATQNIPMDKLAEADFEVRDEEKTSMLKTASELVRSLQTQVYELEEKAELRKEAESLAKKMCKSGHISQEDLLDKVAELSEETRDELRTLDRALEFAKTANPFGSLSNENKTDSDNPFMDYILS
jgi:hypothetical protein